MKNRDIAQISNRDIASITNNGDTNDFTANFPNWLRNRQSWPPGC